MRRTFTFKALTSAMAVAVLALGATPVPARAASAPKVERFDNWEVRCVEGPAGCVAVSMGQAAQVIVAQPTARKAKGPLIAVHIPPTSGKGEPVALHLDSGLTFQVRIWNCTDRFCEAQVDPNAIATVLPLLIADTSGVIAFRIGEDMHVVPFSLIGFSKALKAIRK